MAAGGLQGVARARHLPGPDGRLPARHPALELVLKAGVYRRPRRWLAALVPVFLVFNLWDWVAIRRGHWSYSSRFTTGIESWVASPGRSWSSSWSSRPAPCSPTRPSSALLPRPRPPPAPR